MGHDEFVRLYRAGRVGIFMDDATARHLVENHPSMPGRYRSAHTFWSWVWMLTGLISCGLIPLIFGIRAAINKSAREFVAEFALENASFYDQAVANRWFEVRPRA
jgi:hypothetical protein